MIKFFRKIRQQLLSENKFSKYLIYAVGEIVLVVIGILIALSINNSNERRKLNALEQHYYKQILVDLEADKNYANSRISKFDSSLVKYSLHNEIYKEPNLTTSKIFAGITTYEYKVLTLLFRSTTIETLINTGDIKLMPPEIRNILQSYHARKENIEMVAYNNNKQTIDILKDMCLEGASQNLISSLQIQPELMKELNMQRRFPEILIKAEAYFDWKAITEDRNSKSLKDLIQDIESNIEIINRELNN